MNRNVDEFEVDEIEVGKTVSAMSALYQSMAAIFTNDQRHRTTARSLLLATGVWMPLEVYYQWPVMLPWIVRKNNLGAYPKGFADPRTGLQWQDNGPVGGLKDGVPVEWAAKGPTFKSKSLRSATQQWWQAHVWDEMTTDSLTNSFVPNLVWLPEAIGRLTDADSTGKSTLFQEEIKTIAWALYRDAPVHPALLETVEGIWAAIPEPATLSLDPEDQAAVNWFKATAEFQKSLVAKHSDVWGAVNELIGTGVLTENHINPKPYRDSLPTVTPRGLANLRRVLEPFAAAAVDYLPPSPITAALKVSKAKASTGKAKTSYVVRTAAGETTFQARSQAAREVVRSVLECGVAPSAVKEVIKAKVLIVHGAPSGDDLLQAMVDAGAAGVPKNWYTASPIRVGDVTCIVNSQTWYERDEKLLALLADLTDGHMEFEVRKPDPMAEAMTTHEDPVMNESSTPADVVSTPSWDDPSLFPANEPARVAKHRQLQSRYRQEVLHAKAGASGNYAALGSYLDAAEVAHNPGLNFLSEAARQHADEREVTVREEGGTLDPIRLRRNMLSSMPLCFNLFGTMRAEAEFIEVFRECFDPDVVEIRDVVCEWAPNPASAFLGDRTAFDAVVFYATSTGLRFLGVETKYTEPFSATEYSSPRYDEVTRTSGWFRDPARAPEVLKGKKSNQLWRNLLLAASVESVGLRGQGGVAVVALADDPGVVAAVDIVRPQLVEKSRLVVVTLDDIVTSAARQPSLAGWASAFRRRYLG